MNYKFTYKSPFEKRSLRQRVNKLFSDLIFYLYGSWLLKKFKLDRNEFLKGHIIFDKKRKIPKLQSSTIPENPNLKIYSITFLDCIEIANSNELKNRLIKIVSRHKGGFLSEEPSKKLKKAFDKFDSAYKTISWGNIFYNDTKDDDEIDLIDGVSYGYIKGAKSYFTITYTIYPSEKFQTLFEHSLNSETTEESEIIFKSFKQMIKTKRLFTSIGYNVKHPSYLAEKLFNEINFQFKTKVISDLKLGTFKSHKGLLFPKIIAFEYDQSEFINYKDELFHRLKIGRNEYYDDSDIIFTLKNIDYSKAPSSSLELFIPYKTKDEKIKDQFNTVSYLSDNYIMAIAPKWALINVASLSEQTIVHLRKKIFFYIKRNRVSLFLRKAIKLKNRLTVSWINYERLRKDFSNKIFKDNLKFHGIPDALNIPWFKGAQPEEFKNSLVAYSKNTSIDIKKSFEELLELFRHISEDNVTRANMRLQKLLFWIAIIGVILAIYSSNNDWVNSWIEYYLNNWWDITIPKVPK